MLVLLPVTLGLQGYLRLHPQVTESLYSRRIYPVISAVISPLFGLVPFSAAEALATLLALWIVWVIARSIVGAFRRGPVMLLHGGLKLAGAASLLFFLFYAMWGFNYYREPLAENMHYRQGTPTASELSALLGDEVAQINAIVPQLSYGSNGQSTYDGGFAGMRMQANAGYGWLTAGEKPSERLIDRVSATPKALYPSGRLAYTGIEGIFIPFTYEPTVNTDYPLFVLPFTLSHEIAHFKGFAREDEANFLAYMACLSNPDIYYRYSGHMNALMYLSNALYAADKSQWQQQMQPLDKRAAADLQAYNEYVTRHEGKVDEISNQINDRYLRSQGQSGVISYDEFVVLLADRYRTQTQP